MADFTPAAATSSSNCTPTTSSCFQRTVTLYDWWLVKSSQNDIQRNRLAISGISSRKEEAVRVFNSAPIIKRYDKISLETVDGIYVLIRGFINKQRTLDNGFTPQIFKSFLFGFPDNWESCVLDCFREESETGADSGNAIFDNVSAFYQEILSDGEEKSSPASSVLPEEAPENCKTPFLENECKISEEMSGVDVACGSGKNRCSTRLHTIKVCQQTKPKQHPASRGPLQHPDEDPSSTSKPVENHDSETVVPDNVPANPPEISSDALENSVPTSLVSPEKAMRDCNKSFLEDEQDMSIKMSEINAVHGSGCNRRSVRLHNVKVSQKKQPASGDLLKNPEKEQSSTLKVGEKCDLDTAVPDNVSANLPEISSDALGNSVPTSLVSPEKAMRDCNKSFLEDEQDMSIKMSEVNAVHGSGCNRRSVRLHNVKVSQKKQPASGDPLKNPEKEQSSTLKVGEKCDLDTAVPDNVSANLPEISSDALENSSVPTSLVSPEKAMRDCNKSFLEDEQDMSIKRSEVNVVHGSGCNRRSGRLHNVKVSQKKQPASGDPFKNPEKEQSSALKVGEKCDLDTAVPDNVSVNLPEISSDVVEKLFPTSLVSLDKTTGDCNKAFIEDERDMSIKTGEVNVVHGCGGNRRSARLHNVKLCQKKQPATEDPATHPDKDQISASAALAMSDGGLESLSSPVQSQKGRANTMSGQVTNKLRSRNSKTFSAKTEGCYKRKRVTVETEAVTPNRKIIRPTSSVKSPQGRDVSHSNKESTPRLSTVSPESLSLKKSRSGRWLLPRLEFWRNQTPIYNMDREITEIQEGSSLISP